SAGGSRSPRPAPAPAAPSGRDRPVAARRRAAASSGLLSRRQEAGHDATGLLPLPRLLLDLLPPGLREPVELRLPVVLGDTPFGGDVTLLLQLQERRIEGPVVDGKSVAARLLDPPCDAVPVPRPQGLEGLQPHDGQ